MNAIDKLFHLLEQFTDDKSQWGVRELSARIGLSPNLTHWYLKNLERNRVVRKDPDSEKYELGYRIFELANRSSRLTVIRNAALSVMSELSHSTGGTTVLRVLDGAELLCLASIEGPSSLRVHYAEGTRVPCNYGCVGKVLMAYGDERQAEKIFRINRIKKFTDRTVLDLPALRRDWAKIRLRGWAYTNGETIPGARAVAAPVWDSSGRVCAGLGVTFPSVALPKSRVNRLAQAVVEAANKISRELGWMGSVPKKVTKAG
ncbi:MAG: IclR family transcriptional regulator [Candidatus Binatia bacterium]